MNETGLIVAEVAFLVLLYAFVWTIVRSSSRQLRTAQPPARAPEPAPVEREPAPPAAVAAPAPPVPPSPPTTPAEPVPPAPVAPLAGSEDPTDARWQDEAPPALHANIHPQLVVESSDAVEPGRVIDLAEGMTIGRSEAASLSLPGDQFVSHMHARIMRRGAYHFVEDLGSTNGTFLNDRRIERDAQLKVHDMLRIGQTILRYRE